VTDAPHVSLLAPGIHLVRVPMPGGALAFSNAYLIEDALGALHVVDPGSPGTSRATLLPALARLGRRPEDIASIVVTHLHPDHAGAADELRSESGAVVLLHERERDALRTLAAGLPVPDLERWGVPADRRAELLALSVAPGAPVVAAPDVTVADGDVLDIPGRSIQVVATPGHTPGHLCLHDADARLVVTGDHVLEGVEIDEVHDVERHPPQRHRHQRRADAG